MQRTLQAFSDTTEEHSIRAQGCLRVLCDRAGRWGEKGGAVGRIQCKPLDAIDAGGKLG